MVTRFETFHITHRKVTRFETLRAAIPAPQLREAHDSPDLRKTRVTNFETFPLTWNDTAKAGKGWVGDTQNDML